jgi:hypothetical protein
VGGELHFFYGLIRSVIQTGDGEGDTYDAQTNSTYCDRS